MRDSAAESEREMRMSRPGSVTALCTVNVPSSFVDTRIGRNSPAILGAELHAAAEVFEFVVVDRTAVAAAEIFEIVVIDRATVVATEIFQVVVPY